MIPVRVEHGIDDPVDIFGPLGRSAVEQVVDEVETKGEGDPLPRVHPAIYDNCGIPRISDLLLASTFKV